MVQLSVIDYKEEVYKLEEYLKRAYPIIVFDLETTGLKRDVDKILSCSAIKLEKINGVYKETNRINQFINPGFNISNEVTEINGIDNETVKDAPKERDAMINIKNFFGDNPIIIGYNSLSFDQGFMEKAYLRALGEEFKPLLHIDVYKMVKEKIQANGYKLSNIANELGADIGITFHQSMDDVIATLRVFKIVHPFYFGYEHKSNKIRLRVINARLWDKGHRIDRIYINTEPKCKVYYDCYKRAWFSEQDGVDLRRVREDILKKYNVDNEKDFKITVERAEEKNVR